MKNVLQYYLNQQKNAIRFLLIIGIIISSVSTCSSQLIERHADSILRVIARSNDDTIKANALADVAFDYYLLQKAHSGIYYGEKALELSTKLKWKKGQALAHNSLGANFLDSGKTAIASQHFKASLAIYTVLGQKRSMANCYMNLGNVAGADRNYYLCLEYYDKATKIAHEINAEDIEAITLYNSGFVYGSDLKITNKAFEFLTRALDKSRKIRDQRFIELCLQALSVSYQRLDSLSRAMEYTTQWIEHNKVTGDLYVRANLFGNTSLIYSKLKQYDPALEYAIKSYQLCQTMESERSNQLFRCWALYELGHAIAQLPPGYRPEFLSGAGNEEHESLLTFHIPNDNKTRKRMAVHFLDESLTCARDLGDQELRKNIFSDLVNLYRETGQYTIALAYADSLSRVKDSLYTKERINQLNNATMKLALQSAHIEDSIASQQARDKAALKLKQQKNYTLTGIVFAFIALVFSFFMFRTNTFLSKERKTSEKLLLNILPKEIAEELKVTGEAVAKHYDRVTVLFTDFVNFTGISEQLSATELVSEIHRNFTAFDEIVERHGLEKIKTIGDAYLAVCGLPNEYPDHAQRVVRAALDIRQYMESAQTRFNIRIGIHSGSVVAGIVGKSKYAYDIWGDTVNTAARMEQHSEPGKINISESTWNLVKHEFVCESRGKIKAKNKGEIEMFFVEKAAGAVST